MLFRENLPYYESECDRPGVCYDLLWFVMIIVYQYEVVDLFLY